MITQEDNRMKVSVIIPTYNRVSKLTNLLISLENQTFKNFETVVVDDGSTDSTQFILLNRSSSLKKLKVFHQKNQGHAYSRNRGAKEASGDLLIFFDSDVRPLPNCVERHFNYHLSNHKYILTGRSVMDDSLFQNSDVCQYRYYLESEIWSFPSYIGLCRVSSDNYFFSTQNLSLLKSLFITLGSFDESLKDSVDFDLCVRAMKQGIPIFYDHNTSVWHDDQGDLKSYVERQIQYRKARLHLAKKKPEYVLIIPNQFSQGRNVWVNKLFGRFFVFNKIWKKILENRFYLTFFPKLLRFKLYGYIVHFSSIQNVKQ